MKVLGIDYGAKRIGIATGDDDFRVAYAKGVILNKGFDFVLSEVLSFVKEYGVKLVVVGLPLNMDDYDDNPILAKTEDFVMKLRGALEIDVEFLDERFSSFEADELIADIESKGGAPLGRDAYAAAVILQRYFDNLE